MTKVPPKDVQVLALQAKDLFLNGFSRTERAQKSSTGPRPARSNPRIAMPESGREDKKAFIGAQIPDSRDIASKRISKQLLKEKIALEK
jgi:hypothetical protein